MRDFNVNINIRDCLLCNGCRQVYEKEVLVTNTSQTIAILNGYILNVLSVTNSRCTVIIQNGPYVIIRNIYDFETQICIPSKKCKHFITLSCSNES